LREPQKTLSPMLTVSGLTKSAPQQMTNK